MSEPAVSHPRVEEKFSLPLFLFTVTVSFAGLITLVKLAAAAVTVGDLEGAISALERLLLIDGDNPDVQLELGVLYFRLGSMEAARSYLQVVRDSRRATAETKMRAVSFLREARGP